MERDPVAAARWLINRHGLHLPMKPFLIAKGLGIEIVSCPLSSRTSGCLIPEPIEGQNAFHYLIVVNSLHPQERQMFTVAHELGHWTMHRYMKRNFVCGQWPRDLLDMEANAFAAELLMPEILVRRLAPQMTFVSLASVFGVSLAAMQRRLKELRLSARSTTMVSM